MQTTSKFYKQVHFQQDSKVFQWKDDLSIKWFKTTCIQLHNINQEGEN